jgi:hypothetical protein
MGDRGSLSSRNSDPTGGGRVTVYWRGTCRVVAVGLIGANYHFLSDILSGMFVGISVGYITTKMSPNNAKTGFST